MKQTLARFGALALVALALTGCVRVTSLNSFSENDTISQDLIVALEPAAAEQLGIDPEMLTAESFLSETEGLLPGVDASKVTIEDYADGDLRGVRIVANDLTFEEFNSTSAAGVDSLGMGLAPVITVERQGDDYVITIPASEDIDLAGMEGAGSLGLIADSVDVSFTFEFPGPAKSTTAGKLDGKRVTIGVEELVAGQEIVIRGQATQGIAWGPILRWAGIIGAALVIVGGAGFLIWQDKRKSRQNSLPPIPPAPEGA